MHLLILGYSSIVRRRVLPAARSLRAIRHISVASRSQGQDGAEGRLDDGGAVNHWYADYPDALDAAAADLVYVSGVNAVHGKWVMHALRHGCHVLVDKPAFPDLASAEAAVRLARKQQRGLAEATVFLFHPQAGALRALVDPAESAATRVTATFSFPPLPPDDFRYRADCGGGSLYDLGPYAAATNRLLFGRAPDGVHCMVLTRDALRDPGVDTSFSILMTHANGGSLAGHFGFVTAYQNRLSVVTDLRTIDADRLFTTPPDLACTLRVRETYDDRAVPVAPGDAFALFLEAFIDAVGRRDFEAFERALLEDAALLARVRQAAGVE
ncbi:MAG: Gfo/Idh/MocA family oxidoreductase [Acidobacteria bacterium]|nr:Gfo/Idh/MocA family oxidoreductase [Acidobacteriota bacterium]